ncbi:hypothetical protein HPB52_002683 [Rhipicephalus sanguineus]|uniref:Tick transposon n=1 Tax=Rhipicephalus sanguineus TaxID=34632 RepID=A0A9D4QGS0_RHISA|nr:hypothetical protein HPB52_002683 [Rhipicephalus sanguineus]
MTPLVWDTLKEAWKSILQEEGRARKRRLTDQMNELLRRMRIVRGAETLTACTRDYLDCLVASYARLLKKKTRKPVKAAGQSFEPPELVVNEVCGNGGVQIAEAKRPDGSVTTDPNELEAIFRNYFRAQFQATDSGDAVPSAQRMHELCKHLQRPAEEEFTTLCGEAVMDELVVAIRNMPPNSAPGVDGFSAGFYATFLDILGEALLSLLNLTLVQHERPDSFGAGRIALLLKDGAPPNDPSSWRPITLLNVDYKILVSILNNRIRIYLPDIISPIQSCAVPG